MIVTCCNRKSRMTHIFWVDQYKKGFSFIFLTKQKDDSSLGLCWKVVMRKLSFRHHFSIKTLTSFLKAPTNWKWWSNNDFFHKKFETLRKDHLVSLMKKFCYTHYYSLYHKSFTHIFIQVRKLRVLLHIGTLRSLING